MLAREVNFGPQCIPQNLTQRRRSSSLYSQGRPALICRASKTPTVKLDFQTSDGSTSVECESGDILRDVMLDQKVDLYTTWGKVWTCGGNGQCGTCVVKVHIYVFTGARSAVLHTNLQCNPVLPGFMHFSHCRSLMVASCSQTEIQLRRRN